LPACSGATPLLPPGVVPESPSPTASIILIGDAGGPRGSEDPVLRALATVVGADSARTTILFLGDNVYPHGIPPADHPKRRDAEHRLAGQVAAARAAGARAIFLPGNHDWAGPFGGESGWASVRRQGELIAELGEGRARMLPASGCPGPWVEDLDASLRLVVLDTQWWLHSGSRPSSPGDGCPTWSEAGVLEALRDAVCHADGRQVIVAGHHPLLTAGPHGGHFTLIDHLFPLRAYRSWLWLPLPVAGSMYPHLRRSGLSRQDLSGAANRRMVRGIAESFRDCPPLVYAAGHEHALQLFDGGEVNTRFVVVSGAGYYGHHEPVTRHAATLAALSQSGFFRLDAFADGQTRLTLFTVDRRGRPTARGAWSD
jgi:hypothetical protein